MTISTVLIVGRVFQGGEDGCQTEGGTEEILSSAMSI